MRAFQISLSIIFLNFPRYNDLEKKRKNEKTEVARLKEERKLKRETQKQMKAEKKEKIITEKMSKKKKSNNAN